VPVYYAAHPRCIIDWLDASLIQTKCAQSDLSRPRSGPTLGSDTAVVFIF
jgi:hypothetical protein